MIIIYFYINNFQSFLYPYVLSERSTFLKLPGACIIRVAIFKLLLLVHIGKGASKLSYYRQNIENFQPNY